MNAESIVSKVWSFCTTLRDDGVGYGDYLEQLTYLIFLKMAQLYDEQKDLQNNENKKMQVMEKLNKFIFLVSEELKKLEKEKEHKEKKNVLK